MLPRNYVSVAFFKLNLFSAFSECKNFNC